MAIRIFWYMTLCCWLSGFRRFEGTYCLHLQGPSGPWKTIWFLKMKVTDWTNRGSNPCRNRGFFFSPKGADRHRGPPSLVFSECRCYFTGIIPPGREALTIHLKNMLNYTPVQPCALIAWTGKYLPAILVLIKTRVVHFKFVLNKSVLF